MLLLRYPFISIYSLSAFFSLLLLSSVIPCFTFLISLINYTRMWKWVLLPGTSWLVSGRSSKAQTCRCGCRSPPLTAAISCFCRDKCHGRTSPFPAEQNGRLATVWEGCTSRKSKAEYKGTSFHSLKARLGPRTKRSRAWLPFLMNPLTELN